MTAGPEHAPCLAAIHATSFPAPQRWDEAAIATLLAMPGTFAMLDPGGAMIMARVAADELEILTLGVSPPLRRRGRGRALLHDAALRGWDEGARTAFLEVAEANLPARRLYAGAGFGEVGRRRRYYPGGGDALVLRAVLPLPG